MKNIKKAITDKVSKVNAKVARVKEEKFGVGDQTTLSEEILKMQEKVNQGKNKKHDLLQKQHDITQEIETKQAKIINVKIDKEIEDVNTIINEMTIKLLQEKILLKNSVDKDVNRLSKLQEEIKERIKLLDDLTQKLISDERKLADLKVSIDKNKYQISANKSKRLENDVEVETLKKQIEKNKNKINNLDSRAKEVIAEHKEKIKELESNKQKIK